MRQNQCWIVLKVASIYHKLEVDLKMPEDIIITFQSHLFLILNV